MNKTHLQWRLGKLSSLQFYDWALQNEIDKLKEAKAIVYSYRKSSIAIGITSLALDPSGQFLLSTGEDGSVGLWALDESRNEDQLVNKRIQFAPGKSRDVGRDIDYHSKTHVVARRTAFQTGRNGQESRKFYASVQPSIRNALRDPQEASHTFSITRVQWYPADNGLFFTGSNDQKVNIWDTNAFQVVSSLDLAHRVSQLDAHGDLIAVATEDSHPRLIDLKSMSATISLGVKRTEMRHGINTAKFSRSESSGPQLLATGDNDGNVRVWDLRMSNRALCDLTEPDTMGKAHARCCNDICWNPSGTLELVTTGNDGKCKMWSLDGSKSYLLRQLGATDLMANRFRRRTSHYLMWEGSYVFCNSDHGEIVVYQSHSGRQWHSFQYPLGVSKDRLATPRFQSMAIQTRLANTVGVRLVLGTDNTHGKMLEYRV
ncbi:LANO_0A03400g1_1 [Lachancea nothofagi CBS 11611]|uniref:LANO_0A03400g1_1 n=1 Tax=Lachancea nothofagi CBS 11611 TaxID=1266666 RepID=A0A1G4IQ33_9SACH|nr:LANO_0A03400g1_1 [Lachancea nothofagi CBS 11611]